MGEMRNKVSNTSLQPGTKNLDFKKSCVYQIYPKSFKDSNGDGFGDINGITEKLDYLKLLGVDYIWTTPFFTSPQRDNGYDVADYRSIDPRYGTMEDVKNLIKEGEKRQIGLMFDMVFNHTSTEHEWFQKAMAGDPVYKEYYIFKKGTQNRPPTNWQSKFGGSAWEYVPESDDYYLHLFDKTQADLNWDNPSVRRELSDILRYWQSIGVRGFRFDVVNLISKPDRWEDDPTGDGRCFYTDGPRVHQYLKELNESSGLWDSGMLTVGEMSSTSFENCVQYTKPLEKELNMVFNFHHLKVDYKDKKKWELQVFDFAQLKSLFHSWQTGMEEEGGWNALFWCNHDQPRIVSRFGDELHYRKESAKMLAAAIHFMRGTPYIYQGEEIGMTNAHFTEISQYRDVESLNYYRILKSAGLEDQEVCYILQERSRDNSRTPMQWSDEKYGGFSQSEPWIEVTGGYHSINADKEMKEPDSVFAFYQKLIQLRKEYVIISEGGYRPLLAEHDQVLAYERILAEDSLIVLNNFYGKSAKVNLNRYPVTEYRYLLDNYGPRNMEQEMELKPYETAAFLKTHIQVADARGNGNSH